MWLHLHCLTAVPQIHYGNRSSAVSHGLFADTDQAFACRNDRWREFRGFGELRTTPIEGLALCVSIHGQKTLLQLSWVLPCDVSLFVSFTTLSASRIHSVGMTDERWIEKYLEGRDYRVTIPKYFLRGLTKIMNISKYIQCSGLDPNRVPPECEPREVLLQLLNSVFF